jgi:hypothetical protein
MTNKTTGLLAAVLLLTACPGSNNGVAPTKDAGEIDTGIEDDVGETEDMATADVAPDLPAEPGSLVIEPTQITFEDVRHGEMKTANIAVSNVGGKPLTVTTVELQEFNRRGNPEFLEGDDWQSSFTVGPGLFQDIDVVYAPDDYDLDAGQVRLQTNDPDNEIVEIRLTTVSAYADIEAPTSLRFGEVDPGEELVKEITLYNRGIDPLTITEITTTAADPNPFSQTLDSNEPLPTVLEKDEDYVLQVHYNPTDSDTDRGTVTITSDDPDEETFEIALTGNDPSPCIQITPNPVDLGKLTPGEMGSQSVTMLNCSQSLQLQVGTIELVDDGGGVFTIDNLPEVPATIAPLQTESFQVSGGLADPGTATGEVNVESNGTSSAAVIELRLSADEEN